MNINPPSRRERLRGAEHQLPGKPGGLWGSEEGDVGEEGQDHRERGLWGEFGVGPREADRAVGEGWGHGVEGGWAVCGGGEGVAGTCGVKGDGAEGRGGCGVRW